MDLLFDNIIFDLQQFGGISTYWYELIKRFQKEKGVSMSFFETGLPCKNVMRKRLDIPAESIIVNNRGNIFLERFLRLPIKNVSTQSIFHSSYFRNPTKNSKVKRVVTIHDFTHNMYYGKLRVGLHNLSKNAALKESDLIIAVSNNTKLDILKFHPDISEYRIVTIHNGASDNYKVLDEIHRKTPESFILFIGSREPYKNFGFAVETVSRLKDFSLYIVSAPLRAKEEVYLREKLGNRYKVFSGITNEELNVLYNKAYCLFYPSSYEGFGIPLLEAMQAGCPIVAHNTSSIPEVIGNAGILIDKLDLDLSVNAVQNIDAVRDNLITLGLRQSQKFSWDICYRQTLAAYRSL